VDKLFPALWSGWLLPRAGRGRAHEPDDPAVPHPARRRRADAGIRSHRGTPRAPGHARGASLSDRPPELTPGRPT
jgi:hypothetical protein